VFVCPVFVSYFILLKVGDGGDEQGKSKVKLCQRTRHVTTIGKQQFPSPRPKRIPDSSPNLLLPTLIRGQYEPTTSQKDEKRTAIISNSSLETLGCPMTLFAFGVTLGLPTLFVGDVPFVGELGFVGVLVPASVLAARADMAVRGEGAETTLCRGVIPDGADGDEVLVSDVRGLSGRGGVDACEADVEPFVTTLGGGCLAVPVADSELEEGFRLGTAGEVFAGVLDGADIFFSCSTCH